MVKKQLEIFAKAKCPVCGKDFIPAAEHVYRDKRSRKRVCTYSCMLTSEKLKAAAARKKGSRWRNE